MDAAVLFKIIVHSCHFDPSCALKASADCAVEIPTSAIIAIKPNVCFMFVLSQSLRDGLGSVLRRSPFVVNSSAVSFLFTKRDGRETMRRKPDGRQP